MKRLIFAGLACLMLSNTALAESNWGLGFGAQGQPPKGQESAEFLAEYDAYYLGDTSQKVLYLTFDAGYENGNTMPILDALKKHGVPATFFLVGHYLEQEPDLVRRMVAEGHIVGNHSYGHPNMSGLSAEKFKQELESLAGLYKNITGEEMQKIYRPPSGKYCQKSLQMAKDLGYKTVFWSLAYADWDNNKQPSRQQAFDKLLPRTHNGAIVLLHNTSKTNAEILDELLQRWKDNGYTFGRLDEIGV
ncbi:MAG: delta-lactam-biosynthetic de-N-acetylase [Oscillospiraceae bacterium]|nr:delta-lactam-biosynthetic de-N-acetylase [Oscillospiraceae bacterium]